jgi:phage baseplate assembly protein V
MNPIAELARRLDSLILPGTVAEVDHDNARCRVQAGELLTAWLPWFARRAGSARDWDAPSVGEQCIVLCPTGEPSAGFVLVGLYSDTYAAPANSATLWRRVFFDGAVIEYDHATHALIAQLPEEGTAVVLAPGGISLIGDVEVTGKITATDDVIAAGISLTQHIHGGVQSGGSSTGVPQ